MDAMIGMDDILNKVKRHQLHRSSMQRGSHFWIRQGHNDKTVNAQHIQPEGIDNHNAQASDGTVFVIIPGNIEY